ncbi:MAG: type II toxin-antitoxin system HicB family antitoxin [Deltaproteobacteria bacterium]|nr:type II toxin-antitoxin system HicB family antitoxin [Deltaproteobacteria bacterium]
MVNKYTYRVEWSEEDKAFIGRCLEFPSLAAHGPTHQAALREITSVVEFTIKDLAKHKEPIPEPFGVRKFSGKFVVRVPSEVHRTLAIEAEKSQVSMNQLVLSRLLGTSGTPSSPRKKRVHH